jgi:hypothetical protein
VAPHDQLRNAAWRKSSYSNGATQCVEAASAGGLTAIRDSKDPVGVILLLTARQMRDLTRRVKTGQPGGRPGRVACMAAGRRCAPPGCSWAEALIPSSAVAALERAAAGVSADPGAQ